METTIIEDIIRWDELIGQNLDTIYQSYSKYPIYKLFGKYFLVTEFYTLILEMEDSVCTDAFVLLKINSVEVKERLKKVIVENKDYSCLNGLTIEDVESMFENTNTIYNDDLAFVEVHTDSGLLICEFQSKICVGAIMYPGNSEPEKSYLKNESYNENTGSEIYEKLIHLLVQKHIINPVELESN